MVYRRVPLEEGGTEALNKSCNVMKVHISCKIFFTTNRTIYEIKSSPITGLDRPRGFQEIKVPRFRDDGTGWW